MKVSLAEIRSFVDKALDDFAAISGDGDVEIPQDLYWYVGDDDMYDFQRKPEQLEVGSHATEIEQLRDAVRNNGFSGRNGLKFIAGLLSHLSGTKP